VKWPGYNIHLPPGALLFNLQSGMEQSTGRVIKNVLKFSVTGVVEGIVVGWLLSLVSGNIFVVLMIGTLGLLIGVILGIVRRNDP
jgi:F0F1-type ATP synthase assembly protein I